MSEIDQIKIDIAETKAELKHAKDAKDFARRDRLETLLIEQQKEKNILLANQGEFHPALSNSSPSTFKLMVHLMTKNDWLRFLSAFYLIHFLLISSLFTFITFFHVVGPFCSLFDSCR